MNASHHLALLLAAPQPGESAMYRDQAAMTQALLARGFSADRILCLHGRLDRPLVTHSCRPPAGGSRRGLTVRSSCTSAVTASSTAIRQKTHGPACCSRKALKSDDGGHLFWHDLFTALALPAGVRLTLLPDL